MTIVRASTEFLHVRTPAEMCRALESFPRLPSRRVGLADSLGQALTLDVRAPEDLPDGDRSSMDGFAVRASDTFGATESLPLPFDLVGAVRMAERPTLALEKGQTAQIPTGGYLPAGADAVVMKEHAGLATETLVEIHRPVTAGENVVHRGEDVACGQVVLAAGRRLEPWDVGLLAALGVTELEVGRAPRVVVLSTGDEIVAVDRKPGPGQIRDANGHAIAALLRSAGCEVEASGIVPDRLELLREAVRHGLTQGDLVVLSGGSSVGERDLMPAVISGLERAEVLLHGLAIRPGKPTLLARVGEKAVFGLPGHPVSALVVAHAFLVPFVRYLAGEQLRQGPLGARVRARVATSIHSARGQQEYVRVRLEVAEGTLRAIPLFGKSAMLSSLVRADGVIVVPMHAEGIARGDEVEVVLLGTREPSAIG